MHMHNYTLKGREETQTNRKILCLYFSGLSIKYEFTFITGYKSTSRPKKKKKGGGSRVLVNSYQFLPCIIPTVRISLRVCISFLGLRNEVPQTRWLNTVEIYGLTFWRQDSGIKVSSAWHAVSELSELFFLSLF